MYVINVSPIKRGFNKRAISYFSGSEVEVGSIIAVPLGKGSVPALILGCVSASDYKTELKSSDFSLKKIGKIKSKPFFSRAWMRSVEKFAEFYAISTGEAISILLPSIVLKNLEHMSKYDGEFKTVSLFENDEEAEKPVNFYHGTYADRVSHYKVVIREAFAQGKSVFICVSSNEEIDEAKIEFEKGIEQFTFAFKAKMSKKELLDNWRDMQGTMHPILLVASPQWLFAARQNTSTIILENENSSSWNRLVRPFADYRQFMRIYAEFSCAKLLLGDMVFSIDSRLYMPGKSNFYTISEAENVEVQMSKEILSNEILSLVRETKESNKNLFIYSTRKGLSAVTVCRDCGEAVLCDNCSSPVVLYKREGEKKRIENIFKCHQCGESRSASEVCKKCFSWRLQPLGLGVERVAEEIRHNIEGINIFEINGEKIKSSTAAIKIAHKFYKTPGATLIGTEMALSYLRNKIDFCAVASIDSLFAIPDFRIREKIFRVILQMRSLSREKFLIQERNTEKETLDLALTGNIEGFYKKELQERKELNYPPFAIFLKITVRGSRTFVKKEMPKIEKFLSKWNPIIFSSSSERKAAQYAENAVIKIDKSVWPDSELTAILRSLPAYIEFKVDPGNLL